jgi:uncharacterized membrane protein
MLTLVSGLVLFNGLHLIPTVPDARDRLRAAAGSGVYLGVYSLLSAVGLWLIARGYGIVHNQGIGNVQLWTPPLFMRHITLALMLPAFILLAAAYIPSRIRTTVKHPMLAAIKIWALAHLLVRGDLASVLLFGSFLAYGVFDRISVKKRGALGPLGHSAGGLNGDLTAVAVGIFAYALMVLWGHQYFIGVSPLH